MVKQLDITHKNALKIIDVDEDSASMDYTIAKLSHAQTMAGTIVLFKMYTPDCPADQKTPLPSAHVSGRATRRLPPSRALSLPRLNTRCLDRSFLHSAVTTWNRFPSAVVRDITSSSVHAFRKRQYKHLLSTRLQS